MTNPEETPQPADEGQAQEELSVARLVTIGEDSLILIKLPENVPSGYQIIAKIDVAETTEELDAQPGAECFARSIACGCKSLSCACNNLKIL